MPKAPTVRPPNTKHTVDGITYYTYWKEVVLRDGSIVYHKQTETHRRKKYKTKEKNQVLQQIKKEISRNSAVFSLSDIKKLLMIVKDFPEVLKKLISLKD